MIKPPTPVDELLRLEALRSLKILDSEPEERFDRITRLAKKLFGTATVLVSLVDANRQWFKSRQGLDADETPRDISFCGHAILNEDVMVVADAHDDERFCDNPLVTGNPDIRFYAGCPISAPGGHKVGTLCLIDPEPRGMTGKELELLKDLAGMVEDELVIADFLQLDPLTGLTNRDGFVETAKQMMALCDRNSLPSSLVLIRQSGSANDTNAGGKIDDAAAVEMAQLLLTTFRESDIVGRISEDTYAILLTGIRYAESTGIRQRISVQVDKRNANNRDREDIKFESADVHYQVEQHAGIEDMIADAEQKLDMTYEQLAISS